MFLFVCDMNFADKKQFLNMIVKHISKENISLATNLSLMWHRKVSTFDTIICKSKSLVLKSNTIRDLSILF